MSATELIAPPATAGVERSLSGWGRARHSSCRVLTPQGGEDVVTLLSSAAAAGVGVIARGAGRSYGDAAQNDGGQVLDMTGLDAILSIDPERLVVRAQAGASIAQLLAALAPGGLTLPVVPGTRHVTLAGAIASDIHGKNHHRDGAFARYVTAIALCTPGGELLELTPESDAELFYATLGGMGLTGVIVEATLTVEEMAAPVVLADVDRTDGLEATLEMLSGRERHRYSVAWLDLLAGGSRMGRAIVSRADPLEAAGSEPSREMGSRRGGHYGRGLTGAPLIAVPSAVPGSPLTPSVMRAFNAARWRSSPRRVRERPEPMAPFFFPLDAVGHWNRLYGRTGLIQYQFVVPTGQEAALERCFELIRVRRVPVYLAVFKRFGGGFGGPLSFPLAGWTLAIDVPAAAPGLDVALSQLDEIVAGCGGRVYLSKDLRLSRDSLKAMYPRLGDFAEIRARVDPREVLRSDLGRRLGLCGAAA
jgi:decaprenylphospho-beta-D-ribofuranose 2-oxidase